MFGGIGTIVLVVITRVLVARAWREGIGLTLSRRLLIPVVTLAFGLVALRNDLGDVFTPPLAFVVLGGLVITAIAALVRANTVRYSSVEETRELPGGVRIQARPVTLAADVIGVVCSAALIFVVIEPAAGLAAAGGSLVVVVALGDVIASTVLVARGAPASLRA